MPVPKKIINFLEKSKVKYEIIKHRTVYTAFDKAKTLRVAEKIVGKSLIFKMGGKLAIALIGANKNLDLQRIKKLAKIKKLDFVSEKVIKNKFKGMKVGAVPPFGNLWTPPTRQGGELPLRGKLSPPDPPASRAPIPTFIDRSLIRAKEIILNGGDYNFSIKIKSKELTKLIPDSILGNFSKARSR
jgi:prolyl-tRNA editing enzyme YbaK/EbsC (Cys-tRNA(Pro) deacylase)